MLDVVVFLLRCVFFISKISTKETFLGEIFRFLLRSRAGDERRSTTLVIIKHVFRWSAGPIYRVLRCAPAAEILCINFTLTSSFHLPFFSFSFSLCQRALVCRAYLARLKCLSGSARNNTPYIRLSSEEKGRRAKGARKKSIKFNATSEKPPVE